jgi:hypothetical protein
MTIERELLKEVLEYFDPLGLNTEHCGDLPERIKELLAQPEQEQEQEPVAWKVIDGTNGKYMFSRVKPTERSYKYDVVIPLYTSAQKREPFEPEERQRLSKAYSTRAEQVAFEEGIIFAEISYGIGGGE